MLHGENRPVLRLLTVILDRSKINQISENGRLLPVTMRIMARGTASSEMMDIIGLGSTDKVIYLSIIAELTDVARETLTETFRLNKPGTGIAFTVPLSSVSRSLTHIFSEHLDKNMEHGDEKVMENTAGDIKHDLILALVNEGYVDEVMTAAYSAGATGGTAVSASRVGHEHVAAFLGVELQSEKEIVAILARHETRSAIMRAISQNCGMTTEARGMVMSLPVDHIIGFDVTQE